ncbi:MAG: beta strand repeat-containing protein, partial [Halobaculum sp.]
VNTTGAWTIEDTTLRTVGGNGVYAANATGQWTLRNVTVDNTTSLPGIFVAATDSEWLIENTTVNATATDGITVVETDGDWTVRNTTVTSAGESGIAVGTASGDWTLSNVTVDDAVAAAVDVRAASGAWTIHESSLSNASYGLRSLDTDGDWIVQNTTVRDTTQGGLFAFANGGDWIVENATVQNAGDVGIDARATTGDWTIRNATVDSNAGTGVDASNAVGDWLITNSEVTDNELDGIDAYAATGQWTINETEISGNSRTGLVARGSDTGTVERVYWGSPGSNPHGPGGRYKGGGNRIAGAVGTLGDVYQSSSMTEAVSPPASRTVGETITVGTGQQADTNSIQTALDRVPSGGTVETIVVAPRPESDYTEQIRVGVNVTIEAPGAVLDGPSGSDAAGEPAGVTIPHGANAAPTIEDLAVAGFTWGVLARFTDGNWTLQNVTVVGQSRGLLAIGTTGDWRVVNATVTGSVAVDADSSTGEWVIENSTVTGGSTAVAADSTAGDWQIVNTSVTGQDTGLDATSSAGDWELLAVNVSDGETGVNAARASGNWLIRNSTVSAATTVAGNAPADAGTAVYAVETTGVWTVTETTLTDTARATVNATDAALRGDATNNWWGRQAGPRPDDCVGAVLCRDPLDRQPGGVQLSSVAVTPEVVAGNSVTVTATLTNDALASRTVDLELAVGSRSPKTATVTLTPGETKTVERTFQTDSLPAAPAQVTAQITRSGETVVLGVATNQTTVLDPAFVEIQSVTVPAAPPTGESTLSVGLRNTGEVNASQDLTVSVDTDDNGEFAAAEEVGSQSLQLTPDETRIVSTLAVNASSIGLSPGSYDVLVETANDSVTRELTVLTPANLTVQSLTVPPAAGPSQQVTVQAVLRNDGGVTADQTVTVDVDPQDGQGTSTTRTETVSVSSGATETLTVQFDTSTLEGGSYNVSVTTDDAVTNDTLSVGNEAPELTVSAEGTLALGSFPAGEGTELNVTLTNTGGTPLNVTNVTVVGNDTDAFTLS